MLFTSLMQTIEGDAGFEAQMEAAAMEQSKEEARLVAGRIVWLFYAKNPRSSVTASDDLLEREPQLRERFRELIGQIKELRAAEEDNAPSAAQLTTQLLNAIGDVNDKMRLFQAQVMFRFGKLDTRIDVEDHNVTHAVEELLRSQVTQLEAHGTASANMIERLQAQVDEANKKIGAMSSSFEERMDKQEKRLIMEVEKAQYRVGDRIATLDQSSSAVANQISDVQKKLD